MAFWMFCFMSAGLILLYASSEEYAAYDMCANKVEWADDDRGDRIRLNAPGSTCNSAKTSKSCACRLETTPAFGNVTFLHYNFMNVSCAHCDLNQINVKVELKQRPNELYKTLDNVTLALARAIFDVKVTIHSECISNFSMVFRTYGKTRFSKLKCYTANVTNLSPTSNIDKSISTDDEPVVFSSPAQSSTGSYPMSDVDSSKKKSIYLKTESIVGIVVGVVGGVILIIVTVVIGITIRRRRLEKQDRFSNLSETRQNQNAINENSYGNPIVQPDELISAQPHLVGSHEGLETDVTYVTTMTQDMDVHRNLDPINKNSEVNSYYDLTPILSEENTNLVENDLYGIEDGPTSVEGNLVGNANDTTLVENDLYGTENGPTSAEGDFVGNANDTTLVENDLYGK